jgi:hypothetical protein
VDVRLYKSLPVPANHLDTVTKEMLNAYADTCARRDLMPSSSELVNATARALRAFTARLAEVGLATPPKRPSSLDAYLSSREGNGAG